MARLSAELQRYFFAEDCPPQVKLADILQLAGERTFGFLFVLLSVPSALPLPAAGYSTPFAIVMFMLALQLMTGATKPWLPARMLNSSMALTKVQWFLKAAMPWLQRMEVVCRPRLTFICTGRLGRAAIGLAVALMSIFMMMPIPGTNTVPSLGVLTAGFGLLDDDGAITLAGLVICVLGFAFSGSILIALSMGAPTVVDSLKQWLVQ